MLEELDTLDERFLEHMQARVPKVIDTLRRITRAGEERPLRPQALEPILRISMTCPARRNRCARPISTCFFKGYEPSCESRRVQTGCDS